MKVYNRPFSTRGRKSLHVKSLYGMCKLKWLKKTKSDRIEGKKPLPEEGL